MYTTAQERYLAEFERIARSIEAFDRCLPKIETVNASDSMFDGLNDLADQAKQLYESLPAELAGSFRDQFNRTINEARVCLQKLTDRLVEIQFTRNIEGLAKKIRDHHRRCTKSHTWN